MHAANLEYMQTLTELWQTRVAAHHACGQYSSQVLTTSLTSGSV